MSELYASDLIYRRSLYGDDSVDYTELHRQIENGTHRHVSADEEAAYDMESGSDLYIAAYTPEALLDDEVAELALKARANMLDRAQLHEIAARLVDEAEMVFEAVKAEFLRLSEQHPIYTTMMAEVLHAHLDKQKAGGLPVDEEMYVEASQLVNEIIDANPRFDAGTLLEIAHTITQLDHAERRLTIAEYELAELAA